jgi:integrase
MHAGMKDKPAAANRCVALIDSVWNWGVDEARIPDLERPTKGLTLYPEEGRERFLTMPEMRRLGQAMHLAETTGLPWVVDETGPKVKHLAKADKRQTLVDPYAVAAIRLLILTGARLREILYARWDWLDWDRGILFLQDSKTRKKPVYLSHMALQILSEIPRLEGNPHIFPGDNPGTHRSDLKRPWAAIRRAAGLLTAGEASQAGGKSRAISKALPNVRLHDLRHSFASVGVGSSLGLPMVGKLLGHSTVRSTSKYAHLETDPLHKSVNLIGERIADALALPAPGKRA